LQCRANFRPEFINRVDEFIIFDPLAQDQIKEIVRMQVGASVRIEHICAPFTYMCVLLLRPQLRR